MALVGAVTIISYSLKRMFRGRAPSAPEDFESLKPQGETPSAFMAASMQAVIQKLREQEKELERLHRVEKERAEQTERLSEEVTRNMPAGLLVVNASALISSANPAAETVLGIRSLAFRRYTEALGATSTLACLLARCLEQGTTFRREEIEYSTPDGEVRRLGVTISPILQGSQKISGAICLLSDLTELAALQKQIQFKENLAALGELSAGIAHEFKNALATISGYAQMIRSEASGEVTSDYAGRILEQTRAITHVVAEFLKFARPLELANEQVEIRGIAERVAADVREAIPEVEVTCEGEFAQVSGDEGLLRQALLNLARNAAEASSGEEQGGHVILRGSVEHNVGVELQRICVSDNGPGIAANDLPNIFKPFYTTKINGTGLGLAVVQKIIVQHGGSVEVRNPSQGGAEFILWLPLRRQAVEAVDSVSGGI
jgi:PAS domain S-box-containing protein